MMVEWTLDLEFPDAILKIMETAANRCPVCEGISIPCAVSVRLCSDESIMEINSSCRNIQKSTDVLSFPTVNYPEGCTAGSCEELLKKEFDDETGCCFLGDIVISVPHLYAQAEEYGHSAEREAAYLLVHGICHLMGYDHMTEQEREKMRTMEEMILSDIKY